MNTTEIGTKRKENQSWFTMLLYVLLWKSHSGQRSKAFEFVTTTTCSF